MNSCSERGMSMFDFEKYLSYILVFHLFIYLLRVLLVPILIKPYCYDNAHLVTYDKLICIAIFNTSQNIQLYLSIRGIAT